MTSLRRYALYHAKTTLPRLAVIAVVSLLCMYAFFDIHIYQLEERDSFGTCQSGTLTMILGVAATVMPILELAGFKNRRNLDTLCFLPISRMKISVVHYLNGLFQLVAIGLFCFGAAAIWLLPHVVYFNIVSLLPFCALALLCSLLIYSFFMFIFMQAETTIDGILMMLVYTFLMMILMMVVSLMDGFWQYMPDGFMAESAFVYSPLGIVSRSYGAAIHGETPADIDGSDVLTVVMWSVISLLSALGYFITFPRHRVEKVGGISDSFFGYRVLIPLCGFCLIYWNGEFFPFYAVILILMLTGYIIYRRSLRLCRSDLLMLAISLALYVFRAV